MNHNHWVAVVLDFKSHVILIGNLMNPEPYEESCIMLQWWTSHHSGHQFAESALDITHQQDLVSCGLLSFNALAHHFLPATYPLTSASQVQNGQLQVLLNIVNQHLDQVKTSSPRLEHTNTNYRVSSLLVRIISSRFHLQQQGRRLTYKLKAWRCHSSVIQSLSTAIQALSKVTMSLLIAVRHLDHQHRSVFQKRKSTISL
jgi:hypothetical protein